MLETQFTLELLKSKTTARLVCPCFLLRNLLQSDPKVAIAAVIEVDAEVDLEEATEVVSAAVTVEAIAVVEVVSLEIIEVAEDSVALMLLEVTSDQEKIDLQWIVLKKIPSKALHFT